MTKWISVKDRLPELQDRGPDENPDSGPVLVTDGKCIEIGVIWKYGTYESFKPNYREDFEEVTHWMPLPEAPNE